MPIMWRDDLVLGYIDIDNDHKNWINVMNVVIAGSDSKDLELVKKGIDDAIEYSRNHFYREEQVMRYFNYPDYEKHFEIHSSFIEKINDFQTDMNMNMGYDDNKAFEVAKRLAMFVKEWLVNHIKYEDSKLRPYIKKVKS